MFIYPRQLFYLRNLKNNLIMKRKAEIKSVKQKFTKAATQTYKNFSYFLSSLQLNFFFSNFAKCLPTGVMKISEEVSLYFYSCFIKLSCAEKFYFQYLL